MTADQLLTEAGHAFLVKAFVEEGRSTWSIAKEVGTYPMTVRRALLHFGIKPRRLDEAIRKGYQTGSVKAPRKGKPMSREEKELLSDAMTEVWEQRGPEERVRVAEEVRQRWESLSEEEKRARLEARDEGARRASKEGSRLEREIFLALEGSVYSGAVRHAELVVGGEEMHLDIWLPKVKVAIEIDGPSHHRPIFGPEELAKKQQADQRKEGTLLSNRVGLVRVLQLTGNLSLQKVTKACRQVLRAVRELTQSLQPRVVRVEVQ